PRHPLDARQAGVAMIYQELSLAPHLTVMENIVLGVEPTRRGLLQRDRIRQIAVAALTELGHQDISPDAIVGDLSPAGPRAEEIVGLMVGRALDDLYPRSARARSEAILTVEDLVPGSATFTLHRGEVFGIAGLLGAGRTRLLRTIFGLEPVTSGRIRVAAYSGAASPHERWRQSMGMLSEDRSGEGLARALSVADNITVTKLEPLGLTWP